MTDIVINATPSKPIPVTLVGVDYKVKAPKMSVMATVMKAAAEQNKPGGAKGDGTAVIKHIEDIVKLMFGQRAGTVIKRLEDPEDELDYEHIMKTAEQVIEKVSGNPTS